MFAAMELENEIQKPICDIALDYLYSDQSSFTRAFTSKYGFPPNELRNETVLHVIPNEKYHYEDFSFFIHGAILE